MKTIIKELYIRKMSKAINTIHTRCEIKTSKECRFQKTKKELIKSYCG